MGLFLNGLVPGVEALACRNTYSGKDLWVNVIALRHVAVLYRYIRRIWVVWKIWNAGIRNRSRNPRNSRNPVLWGWSWARGDGWWSWTTLKWKIAILLNKRPLHFVSCGGRSRARGGRGGVKLGITIKWKKTDFMPCGGRNRALGRGVGGEVRDCVLITKGTDLVPRRERLFNKIAFFFTIS